MEDPREYLMGRFLPFQLDHFVDRKLGGFHERLDATGQPIPLPRRLLVHCRQTYTWSRAFQLSGAREYLEVTEAAVETLEARYWRGDHGGLAFSVNERGEPVDETRDAYGHAFALFCLAHAHSAGVPGAIGLAERVEEYFSSYFADTTHGGLHEALSPNGEVEARVRRQNPHMHLVEAYLALLAATGDGHWRARAEAVEKLLDSRFLNPATGTLGEFFDSNWSPHGTHGDRVEPGHHFEWAWILMEFSRLTGGNRRSRATGLAEWAWEHGWDSALGGVWDELDCVGNVLASTKRIWPLLEAIKSARRLPEAAGGAPLSDLLEFALTHYLRTDGRWFERLDSSLQPIQTELPGSTGYHVMMALGEDL